MYSKRITNSISIEAQKLARKRINIYNQQKNCKSINEYIRINVIGSYGEICMSKILHENKIKHIKMFNDINPNTDDNGDIKIGNLCLEIKTRTEASWKEHGNQAKFAQLYSFKKMKLKIIYIWTSYDGDSIKFMGWNYISDWNDKMPKNFVKFKILRKPEDFISMCINMEKNKLSKKNA